MPETISTLAVTLGYAYTLGFLGYVMGEKRLIGAISGAFCCIILGVIGIVIVYFSSRLDAPKFRDRTIVTYG